MTRGCFQVYKPPSEHRRFYKLTALYVLTILQLSIAFSTMQFFKSTVVAILAFSAYATAAALPEPKPNCAAVGNSCNSGFCCLGLICDFEQVVSRYPKFWDASSHLSPSVDQCVPILWSKCDRIMVWESRSRCESAPFARFDSTLNIG